MARRYRHSSVSVWLGRIERGELSRNDAPLAGDVELEVGDRISWRRPPWLEEDIPDRWETIHDDGDLLVINKTDLAPMVGADLKVMERDAIRMRGERPCCFTNLQKGEGLEKIVDFLLQQLPD